MNYYNEFDPKAAAWLRELIAAGHIPPGHVDTRSITEISPHELTGYTQQHFFAGIGGWSLALRLAGWPDTRPVRTGSCPCQPFSAAGKGLGTADPRHLWPVFRDLLAFGETTITFGEQVASAAGRVWLAGIRADLEGMGYAVGSADLCSAGVGSPNIRQRLYWMAHASTPGRGALLRPIGTDRRPSLEPHGHSDASRLADASSSRCGHAEISGETCGAPPAFSREGNQSAGRIESERESLSCRLGDSSSPRSGRDGGTISSAQGESESERRGTRNLPDEPLAASDPRRLAHTAGGQCDRFTDGERCEPNGQAPGRIESNGESECHRAARRLANSECLGRGQTGHSIDGSDRETAVDRRSTRPSDASTHGFWSDYDLLPCTDGKARRIEPGTFPLAHGIPGRVGLLRGYGNAINPWLAAEFILACEDSL